MEKRPVIVCTDPGIDDFIALCLLLERPEFDVLGLVALSGNVGLDITVNNTLVVKELLRREDLPVLVGSGKPLCRPVRTASHVHGSSGLGKSVALYSKLPTCEEDGADFIARMARKYPGALELVSLGPLTDVALAVEKHPDIIPLIKNVLVMGGGIHMGNATEFAEFNIVADPEAAAKVFASGVHMTMMGLNATRNCVITREQAEALRYEGVLGKVVPAMLCDYTDVYDAVNNIKGMIIHDAVCVMMLWHPEWFDRREWYVHVCLEESEHLGETVADEDGSTGLVPNCTVVMNCEAEKIDEEILQAMGTIIQKYA